MSKYCLLINTALEPFEVILHDGKHVHLSLNQIDSRSMSESLLERVTAACRPDEISSIMLINGPGSYTGIRVGVAYAKTLAMIIECPLYTCSTLEAFAWNSSISSKVFAVLLPSKAQSYYLQLFQKNNGRVQCISEINAVSKDEIIRIIKTFQAPYKMYCQIETGCFDFFSQEVSFVTFQELDLSLESIAKMLMLDSKAIKSVDYKQVCPYYFYSPQVGASKKTCLNTSR